MLDSNYYKVEGDAGKKHISFGLCNDSVSHIGSIYFDFQKIDIEFLTD